MAGYQDRIAQDTSANIIDGIAHQYHQWNIAKPSRNISAMTILMDIASVA